MRPIKTQRNRVVCLTAVLTTLVFAAPPLWCAKDTVVVCDDEVEPPTLNPYQVFSEKVHTIIQQMLEGLVRFNADGVVEPALAERWERIDELTVRFHLRRGVI